MAINVEHLGTQVHCPHCQAIVEAAALPAGPAPLDDSATVMMVPGAATSEGPSPAPDSVSDSPTPAPATHAHADLASLQHPRTAGRSALAPILLIFLVPYALLATGAVIYLLIHQKNQSQNKAFDPLERLPDPKPKDGGPRLQGRVKHDLPLPDKLKTRLGQPLTIGALQVTPLKVQKSSDSLILHLQMKNVSPDLIFNPITPEFFKNSWRQPTLHLPRLRSQQDENIRRPAAMAPLDQGTGGFV